MIGRFGVLLAIAGAINWLLVGIFQWNLVQWAFTSTGTQTAGTGARIVYVIVGVGGLLAIPMLTASLARSRSRGIECGGRHHVPGERAADDAQFYLGAPKNEREAARAAHGLADRGGGPAQTRRQRKSDSWPKRTSRSASRSG